MEGIADCLNVSELRLEPEVKFLVFVLLMIELFSQVQQAFFVLNNKLLVGFNLVNKLNVSHFDVFHLFGHLLLELKHVSKL